MMLEVNTALILSPPCFKSYWLLSCNWEYIHVNEGPQNDSKELKMMIYDVLSFPRANTDALK